MTGQEALQLYEKLFSEIKWREPITVKILTVGETDFACRVCIAQYGMNRVLLPSHPQSQVQFDKHFLTFHTWRFTEEANEIPDNG